MLYNSPTLRTNYTRLGDATNERPSLNAAAKPPSDGSGEAGRVFSSNKSHAERRGREGEGANTHLEDLHHHLLVVGDVDGFKDFAVFAAAEFAHQLIIVLVPGGEREKER